MPNGIAAGAAKLGSAPSWPLLGRGAFIGPVVHPTSQSKDGAKYMTPDVSDANIATVRGVAIKDNISTSGFKTTCASAFLKTFKSPYDATVVGRLRNSYPNSTGNGQHGYHIVGKTNMDEFGMGSHSIHSHFGAMRSQLGRSAGGSSGGSAVAVAFTVKGVKSKVALGTDTGGSVRLPAAYSGVIGFKPSYGAIPRYGVVPYANSLDTIGLFANSGGETFPSVLTETFEHLKTNDSRDPTSPSLSSRQRMTSRSRKAAHELRKSKKGESKSLRIGVPIEYNIDELHDCVRDSWRRILDRLQSDGHTIVPVSLPSTKHALSAYYVIAAAEAASNLAKYDGVRYGSRAEGSDGADGVLYANTRGEGFGEEVKRRILLGAYTLSSEAIDNYFIQAQKVRRLVQRDFDRVFAMPNPLRPDEQFDLSDMEEGLELESKLGPAQVDVLVCPTAPTLPPLLDDVQKQTPIDAYMNDVFTVPASLAGLPAISVPIPIPPRHREPLQMNFTGIQVIGQYWDDKQVLDAGNMIRLLSEEETSPAEKIEDNGPDSSFSVEKRAARKTIAAAVLKSLLDVEFIVDGDKRPAIVFQTMVRFILSQAAKGNLIRDDDFVALRGAFSPTALQNPIIAILDSESDASRGEAPDNKPSPLVVQRMAKDILEIGRLTFQSLHSENRHSSHHAAPTEVHGHDGKEPTTSMHSSKKPKQDHHVASPQAEMGIVDADSSNAKEQESGIRVRFFLTARKKLPEEEPGLRIRYFPTEKKLPEEEPGIPIRFFASEKELPEKKLPKEKLPEEKPSIKVHFMKPSPLGWRRLQVDDPPVPPELMGKRRRRRERWARRQQLAGDNSEGDRSLDSGGHPAGPDDGESRK